MDLRGTKIGEVAALWRYPVRSLRGEKLDALEVALGGVVGDRAYGIADPEIGELVSSAQGKRRWRGLVTLSARFDGVPPEDGPAPPAVLETPDGRAVRTDESDIDARLTEIVGRPAKLSTKQAVTEGRMKEPYGHAPIHLLTTASLAAFTRHYPSSRFEAERFRPNLLLDTGALEGFVESQWIGRVLAVGHDLRLVVKDHCVRCVMTTLAQGDLPQDPAILQVVNETNKTHAGIYADVTRPGVMKIGDPVVLVE
jgi:uncharacterized protein YcbX